MMVVTVLTILVWRVEHGVGVMIALPLAESHENRFTTAYRYQLVGFGRQQHTATD
jgi:hypothetical protein